MINELLNLYEKNSNKTPLEDFNTECFAGILKLYPEIKEVFLKFLDIPNDNYKVVTQLKKDLLNDTNCIIDFALIGEEHVCFIENKVESSEGIEQLSRYGKALDFYYPNKVKYLFYCTKYSEPKNLNKEYDNYHFKQFKWYEIANFLKTHKTDNPIIKDYLHFLTKYKMAQDNTFKAENLLTMENLLKTIEIAAFHIDNSKKEFNETFKNIGDYERTNKNFNWYQLKDGNRFSHRKINILKCEKGKWSEIIYIIAFDELIISTYIAVEKEHEQFEYFKDIALNNNEFQLKEFHGWGIGIFKSKPIGTFLNDENSDKSIKDWFINSFDETSKVIQDNSTLKWNTRNA